MLKENTQLRTNEPSDNVATSASQRSVNTFITLLLVYDADLLFYPLVYQPRIYSSLSKEDVPTWCN